MAEFRSFGRSSTEAGFALGRKLDAIPFSTYHLAIIAVLGFIGFVEGYDLSITGSLLVLAKHPLHLTETDIRFVAVASTLMACATVNFADRIVMRPIEALTGYSSNARTHTPAQIDLIGKSLREYGWTNPILVDADNVIVAGHARWEAAKKIGLSQVPTIALSWLTEAQRKAYVIADNQIAITGTGWDTEMLGLELGDLKGLGFDLSLTGFSDIELTSLLADKTEGNTDPDEVPEPPTNPVSVPGDLWFLGRHRLLCGDSTVATDVERVLDGTAPHLMVTDPPYGVNYDPKWRDEELGTWSQPISVGTVQNDDRADWTEAYALFPGDVAHVWHQAGAKQVVFYNSLTACGFEIRMQIVWAKSHFPIGRGHYHVQHEPCWYAVRKGKAAHWGGDRKQSTVWQIANMSAFRGGERKPEDAKSGHGTQKPVECMRRPIENNSSPGQAVYEPFCGSGTTVIAAEMTARACYAIEISPAYCDVILKRWSDFTGKQATLEDGRTFEDVAAHRRPEEEAA